MGRWRNNRHRRGGIAICGDNGTISNGKMQKYRPLTRCKTNKIF
jgi:hypothetical protein